MCEQVGHKRQVWNVKVAGGFKFSLEGRVGVIQAQRMVCSYQAEGQQGLAAGKEELACPVVGRGRCTVEGLGDWQGRRPVSAGCGPDQLTQSSKPAWFVVMITG